MIAPGTLVGILVGGQIYRVPVLRNQAGCVVIEVEGVETYALPATVELPTLVLFRVFKETDDEEGGDVIAVFPCEDAGYGDRSVLCYQHLGQHGTCDRRILDRTRPATPDEYAALKRELETLPDPYILRVGNRWPRR